ncbi:hypothetical protein GCM10010918_50460 [Paenibacillus radicis (ex Gao et al. 2016)]|uniref:Uncharacterized protein n=2 Tax=Paenibacillus radicis (ex Gao et al. 2016) TaxID=1737354 RepID=A0A917HQW7_9BACL|nr:hypothetical protein GCM10010918_50460 [Paenibacillus radicis (ex Gao et al. 2016)]
MLADWYEQGKMEKEIRVALENYLTSYCNSNIRVNQVRIENVPTGFMTIGEDDQEWGAQYVGEDGRLRTLWGIIFKYVEFDISAIECSEINESGIIYKIVELDRNKHTFVEELGTETGYIGIRETDIILMKVFGVVIFTVFLISVSIELLIRSLKKE